MTMTFNLLPFPGCLPFQKAAGCAGGQSGLVPSSLSGSGLSLQNGVTTLSWQGGHGCGRFLSQDGSTAIASPSEGTEGTEARGRERFLDRRKLVQFVHSASSY